jgi:hypothetical protein
MFKMFFYSNGIIFQILNLKTNVLLIFLMGLPGFSEYIPGNTTVGSFRKRIRDNCKEEGLWKDLQSQLDCLQLKIKKVIIHNSTFIHSDPGQQNWINQKKKKQKQGKAEDKLKKNYNKSYFGYTLYSVIGRDYELI